MKNLSIIIPAYNELDTIDQVLNEVFKKQLSGWKKEIIVVDDGSSDGTREALKKWETKCIILYQGRNQGKGAALQRGIEQATGDIVLIQDADLEYSPNNYEVLLAPFSDDRVNVVYGSRFLGAHLSTLFVYELGNKFVTFVTNVLYNTNITDMETGYKVFRKKVLSGFQIHAKRFDVEPEVTVKVLKAGYQIYEVPITYFGRKFSEGKKLTWKDGIMALWTLIKLRL